FRRTKFAPDLDSMGHQVVIQARPEKTSQPGDEKLSNVAADDAVGLPTEAQRGEDEAQLAPAAGGSANQTVIAVAGERGRRKGGIVERGQAHLIAGRFSRLLAKCAQIKTQHAGNSALGDENLRAEQQRVHVEAERWPGGDSRRR